MAIRNNGMWFEGKWVQLENIMLSEISQALENKGHMLVFFFNMWKMDPKDKHKHKNNHDYMQTHM
jgi:hypothetical protein